MTEDQKQRDPHYYLDELEFWSTKQVEYIPIQDFQKGKDFGPLEYNGKKLYGVSTSDHPKDSNLEVGGCPTKEIAIEKFKAFLKQWETSKIIYRVQKPKLFYNEKQKTYSIYGVQTR